MNALPPPPPGAVRSVLTGNGLFRCCDATAVEADGTDDVRCPFCNRVLTLRCGVWRLAESAVYVSSGTPPRPEGF